MVIPNRTTRSIRVTQPVVILGCNFIGRVRKSCCTFISSNYQIGVEGVVPDDVVTGIHDALTINGFLIISDVQHAPHEGPVGFAACFHPAATVHGWIRQLVSVETTFGSLGHDNCVFRLLCLHEREHFGTEVFASVRPT